MIAHHILPICVAIGLCSSQRLTAITPLKPMMSQIAWGMAITRVTSRGYWKSRESMTQRTCSDWTPTLRYRKSFMGSLLHCPAKLGSPRAVLRQPRYRHRKRPSTSHRSACARRNWTYPSARLPGELRHAPLDRNAGFSLATLQSSMVVRQPVKPRARFHYRWRINLQIRMKFSRAFFDSTAILLIWNSWHIVCFIFIYTRRFSTSAQRSIN